LMILSRSKTIAGSVRYVSGDAWSLSVSLDDLEYARQIVPPILGLRI
jgi:hypothetical protein